MANQKRKFKYVFGPVPSRRLGRSLGIDLVTPKTCTLDCVYCQVGRTTDLTTARKEYVPTREVIEEVRARLEENPTIEAITFSGSGEPTLHSGIGEIIRAIKKMTATPVVVLTNGTLLYDPNVRAALQNADVVMPSLDAHDEETFRAVNRPHADMDFTSYLVGLARFTGRFEGRIALEVFFVKGLNDSPEAVQKLAGLAHYVEPDEILLNTAVRPVPGGEVEKLSTERMDEIRAIFGEKARVIADFGPPATDESGAGEEDIIALLKRRPVTAEETALSLSMDDRTARKILDNLASSGKAATTQRDGKVFYFISD